MKKDAFKLISNWQKLLKEPFAKPLLINLFSNANEVYFPNIDFCTRSCFNEKDNVIMYFGVSDDYTELFGIIMPKSCDNLDDFISDSTSIYVEKFVLETPIIVGLPTSPLHVEPYKHEDILEVDALNKVSRWGTNKAIWADYASSNMARYVEFSAQNFNMNTSYTIKLGLNVFMGTKFSLDMVVRNNTTGLYRNVAFIIPPGRK